MRKTKQPFWVLLPAVLASALVALGQATDSNLIGTVFDQTGAAIGGANVELVNVATGVRRSSRTDQSGLYRFSNIPVGLYTTTASAEGFSPKSTTGLDTELNRTTTVNVTLDVAPVSTEVVVVTAASQIDTTSATIGSSFDGRNLLFSPSTDLDLGVVNLSLQNAGIASSGGLAQGDGPSVGGQRPRQNNFTIDGADNNRKDVTGRILDISNEAVAEFSILQNQYSAEFGHSTGGQLTVVLKSGSNNLHGSVYNYFENRRLNAIDEASARQGIRKNPRLDHNRLGGTLGGPIVNNKLFYFGSFEYNQIGEAAAPQSATLTPTSEGYRVLEGVGELSNTNLQVLKQHAPPSSLASGSTTVLGRDIPIGILPISSPIFRNSYSWLASLDYNASEVDQLRFRYVDHASDSIGADILPNLPAFLQKRDTSSKLATLSEVHSFGSNLQNEVRLSYSRFVDSVPAGDFSFPGLDVFPNITIEQDLNLQLGPVPTAPNAVILNTYQLVNNVIWSRGPHLVKFGIDTRKYIAQTNFIQGARGDYNYSNLDRFLRDLNPDIQAQRNLGGIPYDGNQFDFYWYINDEIRLKRNLTLSLGLRHEYKGVPAGDKLQALNSGSSVPGVIEFREPRAQWRNFAPRVGFAYSPGDRGRTVVRAGFGMGYDVYFDNLGTLTKPPQLENTVRINNTEEIPNFLIDGGIRPDQRPPELDDPTARALTSGFIPDQHLPYSAQWNFGVERVFGEDYTVNVRYLGTRGVRLFTQTIMPLRSRVSAARHLPTFLQAPSQQELDSLSLTLDDLTAESFMLPEFAENGFGPAIFAFLNRGNSVYHGLATEIRKRFSKGVQFKGAWTWSHNIDDSTADLFSTLLSPRRPQDFHDMRAERGNSFLDRRHRLTVAWLWETPWARRDNNWLKRNLVGNWLISGVYTAESPQFATVQSGADSNLNLDAAPDRVIVNPSGIDGVGSDVSPLSSSEGQVVGYLASNRNARYIKAGPGARATGGRNTLPLRGINNFDVSISKRVAIGENKAFEFRGVFYNALNHPQYVPGSLNSVKPVSSRATRNNLIPGNPVFNDPTRVYRSNARSVHLVARFSF